MSTLREAAQQALEALKGYEHMYGEYRNAEAAITALRAALAAQPAEQEPVAVPLIDYDALIAAAYAANKKWAQGTNGCVAFKHGAEWFRLQTLAAAAPEAPQPKAEPQEPVATIGMIDEDHFTEVCRKAGGNSNTLLYAAPQPRKRLTDEEIDRILQEANVPELPHGYEAAELEIARAIEAAVWGETK